MVIASVGVFWLTPVQNGRPKAKSFDCLSVDKPNTKFRLSIQRNVGGVEQIVLQSAEIRRIFRVGDAQPDYYSASESPFNGTRGNSLYFNRRTGAVVETTSVPRIARSIFQDRCRNKITVDMCLERVQHALRGGVFDRDDCVAPVPSECERWDTERVMTSELQLMCARHRSGPDSR